MSWAGRQQGTQWVSTTWARSRSAVMMRRRSCPCLAFSLSEWWMLSWNPWGSDLVPASGWTLWWWMVLEDQPCRVNLGNCLQHDCVMFVGQQVDVKWQCLADRVPVVLVYTNTGSWGSGVVVNQLQGIVLTCSHVVKSTSQGTIL